MIKPLFRSLAAVLLAGAVMSIPGVVRSDSLESEIELLRSDLRTDKIEIVKRAIHVEGAKADAFWPVYRKYTQDLDAIGDKRVAMIKDYAANYSTMTDAKAKSLVKQAMDLQSQRTALLKKYYPEFTKVLGATEAAKLVQVESLVLALIDLQVGANLPLIESPAASQ
jgi:hypothetical protein